MRVPALALPGLAIDNLGNYLASLVARVPTRQTDEIPGNLDGLLWAARRRVRSPRRRSAIRKIIFLLADRFDLCALQSHVA